MNLGHTIKYFRNQRQIRQDDLANRCSVTVSYLSQLENNKKNPSLKLLSNISDELKIPLPVLFVLSMNDNDIPEIKKEAFNSIVPPFQSYITELFKEKDSRELIQSPKRLGWTLEVPLNKIKSTINSLDSFYREWEKPKLNQDGTPRIKNGEVQTRIITESFGLLKLIQKRINDRILKDIKLPSCVLGGVSPYSNVNNAERHLGKIFHFQSDLSNFFPSVHYTQVYKTIKKNGYSPDVSRLITRLVTRDGKLPQGTPTSTSIANIVLAPLDRQLIKLFNKANVTYTRWVDDLSFSASYDFSKRVPEIIELIKNFGFKINHRKTFYKIGPVKITGIITKNNTLLIPKSIFAKLHDKNISQEAREGLLRYIENVQGSIKKVR